MADSRRFRLVAITPEQTLDDEAERIAALLDAGFDYVHIRKPQMTEGQVRSYVATLPKKYVSRLKMHYFPSVAADCGLGGLHLNARCPHAPEGFAGACSRSCHSLVEVAENPGLDYVFLSPIFNSISKQGYMANFTEQQLRGNVDSHVFALGGVTADKIAWLNDVGFGGCAFLGYLFAADRKIFDQRIQQIIEQRNNLK